MVRYLWLCAYVAGFLITFAVVAADLVLPIVLAATTGNWWFALLILAGVPIVVACAIGTWTLAGRAVGDDF